MAEGSNEMSTVPLRWDEVYFTNCPMVSANNVDQELGWCKTDFKKIGVDYSFFRSRRENDFYPHYIHNLDNLIRFGGLYPPVRCTPMSAARGCWGRRGSTRAAPCWFGRGTRSTGSRT